MRYKDIIEENFLIDDPQTGQLVPFIFNDVQRKYYKILCDEYNIEKLGITVPIREDILKARREGFTSLILALFCADDIMQKNPTNTEVISYRDDGTKAFRARYKHFAVSFFAKQGITEENKIFSKNESGELIYRHNGARFYCGTASARVGQRGGTVHKQLYSEVAHYPDGEVMTAAEIVEGGMRQVDTASGWIFKETTANGKGNFHYKGWQLEKQGLSRFRPRFFSWRERYTDEEFKTIASEFTDPDMLKQEYPATEEEAFLSSGLSFTNEKELLQLVNFDSAVKKLIYWLEMHGTNYIDQCEILLSTINGVLEANQYYDLYCGIDVAKDMDKTTLTILKDKKMRDQGRIKLIAIDSTGAGDFMPDWFERNSRYPIHRIKFSRPQKDIMYKNLRVVIQDKLTELPEIKDGKGFVSEEAEHFVKEMLDLQKQVIGSILVVGHPQGKEYHDDYPDSWAMAEMGYIVINGMPVNRTIEPEKDFTSKSIRILLNNKQSHGSGGGTENFE
jgi:hypothetical protein